MTAHQIVRTTLDLEAIADALKALLQSPDPRVQALMTHYDADSLQAEAQRLANDIYDTSTQSDDRTAML